MLPLRCNVAQLLYHVTYLRKRRHDDNDDMTITITVVESYRIGPLLTKFVGLEGCAETRRTISRSRDAIFVTPRPAFATRSRAIRRSPCSSHSIRHEGRFVTLIRRSPVLSQIIMTPRSYAQGARVQLHTGIKIPREERRAPFSRLIADHPRGRRSLRERERDRRAFLSRVTIAGSSGVEIDIVTKLTRVH